MKTIFFLILLNFFLIEPSHAQKILSNPTIISKPTGVFTNYNGSKSILKNENINGFLIKIKWNQLEKNEGEYDFSIIDSKIKKIKFFKKSWSLAILAGPHSPKYLKRNADFFLYKSPKGLKKIPKYWDGNAQEAIRRLMTVLARKYNNDPSLKLVYVPQMTADGISSNFKTIREPYKELYDNGFTKDKWISAVIESSIYTASAFSNKAIALEIQELAGNHEIAKEVLLTLYNDKNIGDRLGASIWWLNGEKDKQKDLFELLKKYQGDIYIHISGNSSQTWKFGYRGFHYIFWQAKDLGARYIEIDNYEIKKETSEKHIKNFNKYTDKKFLPKKKARIIGKTNKYDP